MAQKTFNNTKINVNFEETSSRQQINSGENISTLFGKIKKFFSDLKSVAFSGSYNDLSDTPTIPSVGNGTITITQNGVEKGTFSVNQSGNKTIELSDEIASNPNLLINPDFAVNQRGQTEYTTGGYAADRWRTTSNFTVTLGDDGILVSPKQTLTANMFGLRQIIPCAETLRGKTLVLSSDIMQAHDYAYMQCMAVNAAGQNIAVSSKIKLSDGVNSVCIDIPADTKTISVQFTINAGAGTSDTLKVHWAKLELGANATRYYPPDPATELAKCQRYYQIRSTGDIASVDLRPTMRTITDIKQRSDGNYEYIAEL